MNTTETKHMSKMMKKNLSEENRTYRSRKDCKLALAKVKRQLCELRNRKEKDGDTGVELIECMNKHRELCNKLRSKGADRRARAVPSVG